MVTEEGGVPVVFKQYGNVNTCTDWITEPVPKDATVLDIISQVKYGIFQMFNKPLEQQKANLMATVLKQAGLSVA